jgi:DNA repair photolyase
LNRLQEGYALIPNPRNANRLGRVGLSPENVDCIVFWTKNPAPMLDRLPLIDNMGYKYYFEFTVTAYGKDIERNLPEKQAVIDTFKRLSSKTGPDGVDWRFDPILKNERFTVPWIAEQYERLCEQLHDYTERCIISFVDEYSHTRNRADALSRSEMLEVAGAVSEIAAQYRLPVFSCAEEINLSSHGIEHSSCIDRKKVEQLIGAPITAKKDTGQRPACGCIESVDVGVYDTCGNGCAYCYAVTGEKAVNHRTREHDPLSPLLTGWPKGAEIITDRTAPSQRIEQLTLLE